MKVLTWGLVVLLLLPIAQAEPLTLLFKDVNNNKLISDVPLILTATNAQTNEALRFARFIDNGGKADIDLAAGEWRLDAKVDLPKTPGYDYFGEHFLGADRPRTETIFLVPGGTLRGTVVDKLNNLVGFAELKFDCATTAGIAYPKQTDKFGTFAIEWLPSGNCQISAEYKGAVGSETLTLLQGEIANVELRLDKVVVKPGKGGVVLGVLIAAALAAAAIVFILVKRRKQEKREVKQAKPKVHEKKETPTKQEGPSKRAKAIIETLNGKEKAVVDFLLKNPQSSQAKIYLATGIPKTSLARVLQSLMHKKVIEIQKLGKFKKVKLTEWFMSDG